MHRASDAREPGRSSFKSLTLMLGIVLAVGAVGAGGKLIGHLRSIEGEATPELVLKQLVAEDVPQMATTGLADSTRVRLLRQWAYENIDWSTPGANLDKNPPRASTKPMHPSCFEPSGMTGVA